MTELRFEATREFVRHWAAIKTDVHAPLRSAVSPFRFASLLPWTFILAAGEDGGWHFSLVGSAFYDLYGGELTGSPMSRMWGEDACLTLQERMKDAAAQCRPLVVHSTATAFRENVSAETVLLPLRTDAAFTDVDRFIGLQTFPRADIWWAGSQAISGVELDSVSLLIDEDPTKDMWRRGREAPVLAGLRQRPYLVLGQVHASA